MFGTTSGKLKIVLSRLKLSLKGWMKTFVSNYVADVEELGWTT